jgi:hypothetical protein
LIIFFSNESFAVDKITRCIFKTSFRYYSTVKTYPSECKNIGEIYEAVKNIRQEIDGIDSKYDLSSMKVPLDLRIMYRGQQNPKWPLRPGILRSSGKNFDETSALRHLKVMHHSIFHSNLLSINDLSRAQHYGLRTRLLDFTANLLPSIFFAVENNNEEDTEDTNSLYVLDSAALNEFGSMNKEDKAILMPTSFETLLRLRLVESKTFKQLLSFPDIVESARLNGINLEKDKINIEHKLRYPIAVYPNMDNPRIIAQDGRFVIWGGKEWPNFYDDEENKTKHAIESKNLEDVCKEGEKEILYKINIKNGYSIKKELEIYGINRPKMYQTVDETTRWLNDFWSR